MIEQRSSLPIPSTFGAIHLPPALFLKIHHLDPETSYAQNFTSPNQTCLYDIVSATDSGHRRSCAYSKWLPDYSILNPRFPVHLCLGTCARIVPGLAHSGWTFSRNLVLYDLEPCLYYSFRPARVTGRRGRMASKGYTMIIFESSNLARQSPHDQAQL